MPSAALVGLANDNIEIKLEANFNRSSNCLANFMPILNRTRVLWTIIPEILSELIKL